ncbi:MAG: cache domain-containing protein [Burkholderiales bacterium]
MKRSSTIRTQLLALVMAVIMPMLLLAVYYIADRTDQARAQALKDTLTIARDISARVDDHLRNINTLLLSVGVLVGDNLDAVDANDAKLRTLQASIPSYFNSISVLAPDGRQINSSTVPRQDREKLNFRDRDYFQQALARTDTMVIGDPVISRVWGVWISVAARPLLAADGTVRAVVAVSTRLESIQNLLLPARLPEGSIMTILNAQGIVMARLVDPQKWIGKNLSASPNFQRALVEREFSDETVAADGVTRLAGYTTSRMASWIIYVGIPTRVILENAREEHIRLSALALLIAIFALALAYLMARRISRPIEAIANSAQQITAAATAIATGNPAARAPLAGSREIAALAAQFNAMLDALDASERRFRETLEHVRLVAVGLDAEGQVNFCNDFLLALIGWRREEVLGRNWFDTFIPDPAPVKAVFEQGMRDGNLPTHFENEILTRQGERRLIHWNNIILRDPAGRIIGTTSLGEDITERRLAEQKIREQLEELLRWQEVVLGREERVQQLKAEVNALLARQGEPARYNSRGDS